MTIGGRPKEEGGHKPINLSVDYETFNVLGKMGGKGENRSKFIESIFRPHIKQLDPDPSCKVISQIDSILNNAMDSALQDKDFEQLATISMIATHFEPFRYLCKIK